MIDTLPTPLRQVRDTDGRLVEWWAASEGPQGLSEAGAESVTWLVPLDGSAASLRAVDHVLTLLPHGQANRVHLLHVQGWMAKEAAETQLASRAWVATAEARQRLQAQGVPWTLETVMGEPVPVIVSCADRVGARTIVLGRRGHSPLAAWLLGSVTRGVLEHAQRPITVVP